MFYISSQGHSATKWLSNILNKQNEIVCFHGTRSLPPYNSGINDISPKEFVEGLKQMENNCQNKINFGSCHGYYGTEIKEFIESQNGTFFSLLRNPIMRVNSIFVTFAFHYLSGEKKFSKDKFDAYKYMDEISFSKKDTHAIYLKYLKLYKYYKIFQKDLKIQDKIIRRIDKKIKELIRLFSTHVTYNPLTSIRDDKEVFEFKNNDIAIFRLLHCFDIACYRTLNFDAEYFKNCNDDQIIKMEELTCSYVYLENTIKKISPLSDKILINSSDYNLKLNSHVITQSNESETYNLWPNIFKSIFNNYMTNYNIKSMYVKYDYLKSFIG